MEQSKRDLKRSNDKLKEDCAELQDIVDTLEDDDIYPRRRTRRRDEARGEEGFGNERAPSMESEEANSRNRTRRRRSRSSGSQQGSEITRSHQEGNSRGSSIDTVERAGARTTPTRGPTAGGGPEPAANAEATGPKDGEPINPERNGEADRSQTGNPNPSGLSAEAKTNEGSTEGERRSQRKRKSGGGGEGIDGPHA